MKDYSAKRAIVFQVPVPDTNEMEQPHGSDGVDVPLVELSDSCEEMEYDSDIEVII